MAKRLPDRRFTHQSRKKIAKSCFASPVRKLITFQDGTGTGNFLPEAVFLRSPVNRQLLPAEFCFMPIEPHINSSLYLCI